MPSAVLTEQRAERQAPDVGSKVQLWLVFGVAIEEVDMPLLLSSLTDYLAVNGDEFTVSILPGSTVMLLTPLTSRADVAVCATNACTGVCVCKHVCT